MNSERGFFPKPFHEQKAFHSGDYLGMMEETDWGESQERVQS